MDVFIEIIHFENFSKRFYQQLILKTSQTQKYMDRKGWKLLNHTKARFDVVKLQKECAHCSL